VLREATEGAVDEAAVDLEEDDPVEEDEVGMPATTKEE
jgi:hypothetical protein